MPRHDDLPKKQRKEEIINLFDKKRTPVLTTGDIVQEFDVSRETINKDLAELLDENERLEIHRGRGTNVYYLEDAVGPISQIQVKFGEIWQKSVIGKAYILSLVGFGVVGLIVIISAINIAQGNPDVAEDNINEVQSPFIISLGVWFFTTLLLKRHYKSDSILPWNW